MCFVSKRWRKLTLIRCLTWCLRFLQGISMNLRFSFSRIICCTMLHDVARCTYCAFLWEKQILLVALARIVADSWPWFGDISDIRHCLPTCLPKGSLKRFLDRVEMATWVPLGYGLVTWPHSRILVQSTSLITSSIRRKGDHQMVPCRLASEPSSHHHIIITWVDAAEHV